MHEETLSGFMQDALGKIGAVFRKCKFFQEHKRLQTGLPRDLKDANIMQKEITMAEGKSFTRTITYLGVIILQLIMTQVVTFLVTLFVPDAETFPQTNPIPFTILVGLTFAAGVFFAGWLAIKLRWLPLKSKYPARLAGALIGAFLPLITSLIVFRTYEAGNPVFWFTALGSVLGFYAAGWVERK